MTDQQRQRVTVTFIDGSQLALNNASRAMLRGQLRVIRKSMKQRRSFVVSDENGEIARGLVASFEVG